MLELQQYVNLARPLAGFTLWYIQISGVVPVVESQYLMVQSVAVTEHAGGNKKPVWARPDRLINVYCVNVDFGHKKPVVLLVIRVSFLGCSTQPGNDTPQRELTQ